MAGRQFRHTSCGPLRKSVILVTRRATRGECSVRGRRSALQLSEKSPVNARRQRFQSVSGLADSLLQAALRTPDLRSVSKSQELQRERVRKARGKRLNQNCHSQVLLVFDDTTVDEVAQDDARHTFSTKKPPPLTRTHRILRRSFPNRTVAPGECFLNMRCCPDRQPKSASERNQMTRKLAT